MIYQPSKGQIKDGCMICENGKFYPFSMYRKEKNNAHTPEQRSTPMIGYDSVRCEA